MIYNEEFETMPREVIKSPAGQKTSAGFGAGLPYRGIL